MAKDVHNPKIQLKRQIQKKERQSELPQTLSRCVTPLRPRQIFIRFENRNKSFPR